MAIIARTSPVGERGIRDARRHQQKQLDVIKKRLPGIIAEEPIITGDRTRTIRIPIRAMQIPRFRYGQKGSGIGIGQGEGTVGDVIARRPGREKAPGEAGDQPGEDYIDSEFTVEEIINLMMDDLGLPRMEERDAKTLVVEKNNVFRGLKRTGPPALLHPSRTAREGMRRFFSLVAALEAETGRDENLCMCALSQARGDYEEALALIAEGRVVLTSSPEILPVFEEEDQVFHRIVRDATPRSQAVVLALVDVSGSMGEMKKYLMRAMLFWVVQTLRQLYENIEIRFVAHHMEARVVDEETVFRVGESGGTRCASAYRVAAGLIETEYPTSQWNVYVIQFSDGDDLKPEETVREAEGMIARGINMLTYVEIQPESKRESALLSQFKQVLPLESVTTDDRVKLIAGMRRFPFLGITVERKEHVYPFLREFFRRERWRNE